MTFEEIIRRGLPGDHSKEITITGTAFAPASFLYKLFGKAAPVILKKVAKSYMAMTANT